MDPTTSTIIILVFVFSIIGSATHHKKGPIAEKPGQTIGIASPGTVYGTVESVVPIESFEGVTLEGLSDKIKSFTLRYGKNLPESDAQSISENVIKYSKQYDVNPKLVTALIARESRFNKYAISSSNAQGLGQLLPSTAVGLGVTDPFDIEQNIKGTVRYIKSLLDRFPNSNKIPNAIAGYFEGPNGILRNGGFKLKSKSYVEDILAIYNKI
ncbi:lytic transglycosylase domain-containing protein [Candidatus Saganbacteria bacterium]|nr:lytic transglycosylase domain-containing protein [Candidatus Saganbacteria bacterium]